MLKSIAAPATNDRSPRYCEKAIAAIHQAIVPGQTIIFEYGASQGRVGLFCRFSGELERVVLGPLVANYPRAKVEDVAEADDPNKCSTGKIQHWVAELQLEPEIFPILRHAQFEDLLCRSYADPTDSLLRAVCPSDDAQCLVEIVATPAKHRLCRRAKKAVALLDREFFRHHEILADYFARNILHPRQRWVAALLGLAARSSSRPSRDAPMDVTGSRQHDREADLQAAADKIGGHLFSVSIRIHVWSKSEETARNRTQEIGGAFGSFTRSRLATFSVSPPRRIRRESSTHSTFILSHEELATLWHPPTANIGAEKMRVSAFTELEPPATFYSGEEDGAVTIGQVRFRDNHRLVGLSRDDRRRHVYVIGRTGVGKTTLLLNQICSDMEKGHGVALIDPHGDLATEVVRRTPRHRTNDVIWFDAADVENAISFNPLACPDSSLVDRVTSGAVSAFKKLHADSWGPRLENTLRNAVFATVEQHGTLVSLLRLLTDEVFREAYVPRISDEIVRAFWTQEFASWTKAYRTEAVAAITNKIQPFLTNRSVRAIVSKERRSLNLRHIMDGGKVLIVNLSKGRVGEDNAALLGAFIVTAIQQAAMTRADIPEQERRDHYLYIDEFQNFMTSSFDAILSEARKYRLNLTVSHQYLAQLDDETAAAIAGNVGSVISFGVGNDDAEWLAKALCQNPGALLPSDFINLPRYTAYARLLVDGMPTGLASLATLPPTEIAEDRYEIVAACSRRRFLH
jgi:hypothetical protein